MFWGVFLGPFTALRAIWSQGSSWIFCSREHCLFLAMVLWWLIPVGCKGSLCVDGKTCLVCGGIFFPLSLKDMPCLVFCQLYGNVKAGYEDMLGPLKCLHILWSMISGTGSSLKPGIGIEKHVCYWCTAFFTWHRIEICKMVNFKLLETALMISAFLGYHVIWISHLFHLHLTHLRYALK